MWTWFLHCILTFSYFASSCSSHVKITISLLRKNGFLQWGPKIGIIWKSYNNIPPLGNPHFVNRISKSTVSFVLFYFCPYCSPGEIRSGFPVKWFLKDEMLPRYYKEIALLKMGENTCHLTAYNFARDRRTVKKMHHVNCQILGFPLVYKFYEFCLFYAPFTSK